MSKEIDAIAGCCKALEPIKDDHAALKRIYEYLKARFPTGPGKRQDGVTFRRRGGTSED